MFVYITESWSARRRNRSELSAGVASACRFVFDVVDWVAAKRAVNVLMSGRELFFSLKSTPCSTGLVSYDITR